MDDDLREGVVKLLDDIIAERNRLRAVVEATRTFIAAQDAATCNTMIDAFHQLDENAEATDE